MKEKIKENVPENQKYNQDVTQKQIRGSSLLLLGKFISVGINLASQVLIVRFLSKTDYGAWAYALAIVAFFQGFSSLGLKRAIPRFIPIYHEKEEFENLFGTIFLTIGTIILMGALVVGVIHISPELISRLISGEEQPVTLVLILIFLVPVQAFDVMLIGLFASFVSPKVIFTRKFIVGPGIQLMVVLLLIFLGSDVIFLGYGYLFGNVVAILFYSWILIRMLKKQGILKHYTFKNIKFPIKEIFSFSLPLLASDLVTIMMHSSDIMILGYYHSTIAVASYQVILPAAKFNKLVMTSFALLYTPLAARLFAKGNYGGINKLYWQTAIWMGVLSFPVFALTFSLAEPVTVGLYGARYHDSSVLLQLISLGYYFNVILGFNGLTLKVLGKVRYVVIISFVAVVFNLALNFLFIPLYGALGAAISTALSMILHNILKQAGLRFASGISIFDREYYPFYLIIFFGALFIFLFQMYLSKNIYLLVLIFVIVSLSVIKFSHNKLNINKTFPELLRMPGVRVLFKSNNY